MSDAGPPEPERTWREVLDRLDAGEVARFLTRHRGVATAPMLGWDDHPLGTTPLSYVAMARYDTATGRWRDRPGTGAVARVLLDAGAPVDGEPGASESPLITAASYGDAEVAAVLIAAGADLDRLASPAAGGVPGGSAVLHAAVFGMTDVLDVLVAGGARIRSIEEAAAAGDLDGWLATGADPQALLRALVMAVDHQRIDAVRRLVAAGAPVDAADEVFGRHPLRVAAAGGRDRAVAALLALGADPRAVDERGRSALQLCREARSTAARTDGHDAVERLLAPVSG